MTDLLNELLPEEVKVLSQSGGYFIWLELPKHIDALQIYREALKDNISIAPGKMFSLTEQYDHCIRLNASLSLMTNTSMLSICLPTLFAVIWRNRDFLQFWFNGARRISSNSIARCNVFGYNRASADDGLIANGHAWQYDSAPTNPNVADFYRFGDLISG